MVIADPTAELMHLIRSQADPAPATASKVATAQARLIRRRFGLALSRLASRQPALPRGSRPGGPQSRAPSSIDWYSSLCGAVHSSAERWTATSATSWGSTRSEGTSANGATPEKATCCRSPARPARCCPGRAR